MAADSAFEDGADEFAHRTPDQGGGEPTENPGERGEPHVPAETRDRSDYLDGLRAASGWDAVEPASRPPPDAFRIDADRAKHILDGDETGGGHRSGTGSPGKTEFPPDWDDDTILEAIIAVARRPETVRQQWNERWKVSGEYDRVTVIAIINPDGTIWTAWPPEGSPGVIRNPERGAT